MLKSTLGSEDQVPNEISPVMLPLVESVIPLESLEPVFQISGSRLRLRMSYW